jgi:hypothetical protein
VLTLLPVVVEEPFWRLVKKLDRKDWRAAVPVVAVEDVVDEDDDVLLLEFPEVVPPRSDISLEKAVLSSVKLLAEMLEGAPSAADVALTSWLLPKSLMSDVSASVILD